MKDRLKEVRKSIPVYGKSQESFANFLGIPKANIMSYEIGRRTPSDAVIQLICQKCEVNIDWLRTGEGEMKVPVSPDDRFAVNIAKLQRTDDETIMNWVNMIAETNPEELRQIESIFKRLIENQ